MAADFFPERLSQPDVNVFPVYFLGVNGSLTKLMYPGVALTRTGEGAYLLTWARNPGVYMGPPLYAFGAATPGDLKGYTAVFDTYDVTTRTLAFIVYNASVTAADLIADQYMYLEPKFSRTALLP